VVLVLLAGAGIMAAVSLADLGASSDTCDWAGSGSSATLVLTIPAGAPQQGGAAFGAPAGLTVTSASFTGFPGTFGTNNLPPGTSGENLLNPGGSPFNGAAATTVTAALGLSGTVPASDGVFTVVPTNFPPSSYFASFSCSRSTSSTSSQGSTGSTQSTSTSSPRPLVSNVDPSTGVNTGATNVTITGTGFTGATGVAFGTADATSFSVVSDTQITAVSPSYGTVGTVAVHVFGPGGHSQNLVGSANSFKYTSPPKTTTAGTTTTATTSATGSTSLGATGDSCTWAYTSLATSVTASLSIPAGAPQQGGAAFGIAGDGNGAGADVKSAVFNGIPVTINTNSLPAGTSGEAFPAGAINGSGAAVVSIQLGLSKGLLEDDDDVLTIVPTNSPPTGYYRPVVCSGGWTSTTPPATTTTTVPSGQPASQTDDACSWAATGPKQVTIAYVVTSSAKQTFAFAASGGLTVTSVVSLTPGAQTEVGENVEGGSSFALVIPAPGREVSPNGAAGTTVLLFSVNLSDALPSSGETFSVVAGSGNIVDGHPEVVSPVIICNAAGSTSSAPPPDTSGASTIPLDGSDTGPASDPIARGLQNLNNILLEVLVPGFGAVTSSQVPSGHAARSTASVQAGLAAVPLIAPGVAFATKAGAVPLHLKPTAAGMAALKAKGSLSARLQLTYTPLKGKRFSRILNVTLKVKGASGAAGPAARIESATVTTKGEIRTFVLRIHVSEKATVKIILRGTGAAPFTGTFALKAGKNTVRDALPKWFKPGKAHASIVVGDAQGKTRRYKATVTVP
jgi:hypothetical protein